MRTASHPKHPMSHAPVMLAAVLEGFNIQPEGVYVDATFGRGGHTRALLERLKPQARLLVIDRDADAIQSLSVHHNAFSGLLSICETEGLVGGVQGVLLDLGLCSTQLDEAQRGFSFSNDGPLDMRMDTSKGQTAAEWLNQSDVEQIDWVFETFGEERFHKRLAKAIVEARAQEAIHSTLQLANIVRQAHPAWEKHKHPATRVFQAIRIFINQELKELSEVLGQALKVLSVGGRLVVISFHSLEDRIVKQFIRQQERGPDTDPTMPWLAPHQAGMRAIGRAIKADRLEILDNHRARSAVLRVAEKVRAC
jgi:16S rRNA (cytosine1402-N4)-methyltransferase